MTSWKYWKMYYHDFSKERTTFFYIVSLVNHESIYLNFFDHSTTLIFLYSIITVNILWITLNITILLLISDNKSHLRQTTQKLNPLPETVEKIQQSLVWKMENELYNFALEHFHAVKRRLINASLQDANQRFMYEKIRPK